MSIRTFVETFDCTRNLASALRPTTVVAAIGWFGLKLTFDVPGQAPLGHAVANPPAASGAAVNVISTPRACAGTPLELSFGSIERAMFGDNGDFGSIAGGSPGRLS